MRAALSEHCAHGNLVGGSSIGSSTVPGFPCTDDLKEAYCALALTLCSGMIDNDGCSCTPDGPLYSDFNDCWTAASLFDDTTGALGDDTGDTLSCRLYHAEAAADNASNHCPNASSGGGGTCQ